MSTYIAFWAQKTLDFNEYYVSEDKLEQAKNMQAKKRPVVQSTAGNKCE